MQHLTDLRGKVAVITGGASGIGYAIAERLGREGARIVLTDIEQKALATKVTDLRALGVEAIGVVTDVSDASAVAALADKAWDAFGSVDILANNAGVVTYGPTQSATLDDWDWLIRVNLWGPIHGVNQFLPRMIAQKSPAHVLFTSSFAGVVPNRNLGVYNVTKAGVVSLAESLAKDLRETAIGVSVLCPMLVDSNIRSSARNYPIRQGNMSAPRGQPREGRSLSAAATAELVLRGIRSRRLFIHTHREGEQFFNARAAKISQEFAAAL